MDNSKIIDQNDLEKVMGGVKTTANNEQLMRITCPYCEEIIKVDVQKSSAKCPTCHKTIEIKG